MPIEDPGEPGLRPATPAWPPSGGAAGAEPWSLPTPVRVEHSDESDVEHEEFEQFDWDSWQPGEISDDEPAAEEVDWGALGAMTPAEPTSWREKVIGESAWPRGVTIGEREGVGDPAVAGIAPVHTESEPLEDDDDLEPVPTSLAEPLLASGGLWPPASPVSHDVVHVRVAPWAPFTTGLAVALAMVLMSAAIVSQTGRLGLTLAVLTGQVPTSADAVVGAYLSAISHADASRAISYLSTAPADPLLLTDAVLRKSIEQSPITVVAVKAGSSSINGTQRVEATYTIGDVRVSTAFTTAFSEAQWVIRDDHRRGQAGADGEGASGGAGGGPDRGHPVPREEGAAAGRMPPEHRAEPQRARGERHGRLHGEERVDDDLGFGATALDSHGDVRGHVAAGREGHGRHHTSGRYVPLQRHGPVAGGPERQPADTRTRVLGLPARTAQTAGPLRDPAVDACGLSGFRGEPGGCRSAGRTS